MSGDSTGKMRDRLTDSKTNTSFDAGQDAMLDFKPT